MLQLVFHISNREGRGQKESTEMTQGHNEDNSTVTDVLRKILSSRSKIALHPAVFTTWRNAPTHHMETLATSMPQ